MGLEHRDSVMEKLMLETIRKIGQMEKDSIIGLMETIIKVNFLMD